MGLHIEPAVGQIWADRHKESDGREVKVLKVLDDGRVEVETVTAAHAAASTQAVGRVTIVRKIQARFTYVRGGEPT